MNLLLYSGFYPLEESPFDAYRQRESWPLRCLTQWICSDIYLVMQALQTERRILNLPIALTVSKGL